MKKLFILAATFILISGVIGYGQIGQKRRHAAQRGSAVVREELSSDADTEIKSAGRRSGKTSSAMAVGRRSAVTQVPTFSKPQGDQLERSRKSFDGDLRELPSTPQEFVDRPEHEDVNVKPLVLPDVKGLSKATSGPTTLIGPNAPAPSPIFQFDGLGRANVGNGYPPDTNGDVGPTYYIQTINTGIGIYDKSTGAAVVGPISFNTFMSQGSFGNICDTNNFGDPVVLYDSFDDRWVITDFAFTVNGSGDITSNSLQCFAVSKNGNPVTGGWYYYSVQSNDALADYPKLGVWPDGIYMTANLFGKGGTSGGYLFSREWAFNKAQMYAGAANPQVVTVDAPKTDLAAGGFGGQLFTMMPSNARLQVGTPPAGTPNYFVSTGSYTNALMVWKFHVDWTNVFNSTFTLGNISGTGTSWAGPAATVASQAGNNLDTLATRAMMQNQYTNLGGVESLWLTHTVSNTNTSGVGAAPKWYQLPVTGGTVAASATQSALHAPDTTVFRWMPSLAIDRQGNMLLGYTASNSTMKPAIRWAGRLAADPANTLPQTETDLIQGGGTQTNTCGGTCTRWGDYSAMSLDPTDGCTFWFTSEYYSADGALFQTRIGSTKFGACSAVANGSVSGTVTDGTNPISGASVTLGGRSTTTAADGTYSFSNLPAGTYPVIAASSSGKNSSTSAGVVVPSGGSATQNFALSAAATTSCPQDTSQADFAAGTPAALDLTTSAGNVTLSRQNVDQFNTTIGNTGVADTTTTWNGQAFTPSVTGQLTKVDFGMFCSGCTGTIPNLTVSVRATAAGLPTGADLATATITGFSTSSTAFVSAIFASPITLTAGTRYAIIVRPTANPSVGTGYFNVRSGGTTGADVYGGGDAIQSTDSGTTWATVVRTAVVVDYGFHVFMTAPSGTLISGTKDANPAANFTVTWNSFNWTATTPGSTNLQFQVAASNSPNGPFNFVGTDGTAATVYTTSGGSLAQFNGKRYLKYKAFLASTDPTTSPTIADVTTCFQNNITTAAGVSISGRVLSSSGGGVRGAVVSIIDTRGIQRTTITNAFGYYMFDNVQSGQNFVMRATARGFSFNPKTLNVTDAIADVDFVSGQ
ncbi:MAG: carboxypeptidase regulatory-like domain-containing protein [Pyrinomonadaceae bacterium]